MKEDKYERITNLNLATFLYSLDCPIAGINQINGSQKEFAFVKSDRLSELIWAYKFAENSCEELQVDVRKYEYSRRYLLDRIKE